VVIEAYLGTTDDRSGTGQQDDKTRPADG